MQILWMVLQIVCAIFSFFVMIQISQKKPIKGHNYLIMALACTFIYNLGYIIELLSKDIREVQYALIVEYIGISWLCLLYTMLIFAYCEADRPSKWFIFCGIMDAVVFVSVCHYPYTNIYFREINIIEKEGYYCVTQVNGILYYLHMIECIINICLSIGVIGKTYVKSSDKMKIGLRTLATSVIAPFVVYLLHMCKVTGELDLKGIIFLVTLFPLYIGISQKNIFSIVEIAYEKVIENMDQAIIVVDKDYMYVESNPMCQKIFPKLQEMDERCRVDENIIELINNPEKNEYIEKDGKFYRCHISDIYSKEKLEGYVVTFMDLTETQNNLDKMRELKKRADAANEAKTVFLAHMSHEIRTPINAIMGYSELIIKEKPSATVNKYAKDIKSASESMAFIVNDILDISKIESGKMELVNDNFYTQELIKGIINMTNLSAQKKGLTYNINISPNIPYILCGDAVRIRQIVVNLMSNAIKFTDEGTVSLNIDFEETDDKHIRLTIKVKDTGRGIKEEDIFKIFNQFTQVDVHFNKGIEGTGLGLAITKSLVELMNGNLFVDSVYGKGSEFNANIELEVVDKKPLSEVNIIKIIDENEKNAMRFIATSAKVLVVDDNVINLDVLDEYLRYYKITPDLADSGEKALEMVKQNDYDLVLMDQMMPGMDGIETTRRIRELGGKYKKLKIIAVTANAISGTKELLLSKGFDGYQVKPISMEKLEQIILQHIPNDYIEYIYEEEPEDIGSDNIDSDDKNISKQSFIQGIDSDIGLENCNNDYNQYIKTLKIVAKHGDKKLNDLKNSYENKDYDRYCIEAHALKSNMASIGAMHLSELAKNQELAGKEGKFNEIDKYGLVLCYEYEEILSGIKSWLESNSKEKEKSENMKASFGECMDSLVEIKACLSNKDYSKAFEYLEVLKMFISDEKAKGTIEEIDEALKIYDYASAEKILDVLIGGKAYD